MGRICSTLETLEMHAKYYLRKLKLREGLLNLGVYLYMITK
jgi:hypothetical protein